MILVVLRRNSSLFKRCFIILRLQKNEKEREREHDNDREKLNTFYYSKDVIHPWKSNQIQSSIVHENNQ